MTPEQFLSFVETMVREVEARRAFDNPLGLLPPNENDWKALKSAMLKTRASVDDNNAKMAILRGTPLPYDDGRKEAKPDPFYQDLITRSVTAVDTAKADGTITRRFVPHTDGVSVTCADVPATTFGEIIGEKLEAVISAINRRDQLRAHGEVIKAPGAPFAFREDGEGAFLAKQQGDWFHVELSRENRQLTQTTNLSNADQTGSTCSNAMQLNGKTVQIGVRSEWVPQPSPEAQKVEAKRRSSISRGTWRYEEDAKIPRHED